MENVRTLVREEKSIERKDHRESLLCRNRALGSLEKQSNLTKDDVIEKANMLKIRSLVSLDLLFTLKNSFLEDSTNISAFLHVDGALHALIRALSGQDSKLQIHAAYCLCNLALGNDKQSVQLVKVAGPYLIAHLQGMNIYLIEACAWTLGNLCSHGHKTVEILKIQGAVPAVCRLLSHQDENVKTAAVYCLTHLVYHAFDMLEAHDYQQIVEPAFELFTSHHSVVAFLMSLLSAQSHCQYWLLQQGVHEKTMVTLLISLRRADKFTIWYLRIIANLISETTGEAALAVLNHKFYDDEFPKSTLNEIVQIICSPERTAVSKEFLWFFGNFLNHPNFEVQAQMIESKLLPGLEQMIKMHNNAQI